MNLTQMPIKHTIISTSLSASETHMANNFFGKTKKQSRKQLNKKVIEKSNLSAKRASGWSACWNICTEIAISLANFDYVVVYNCLKKNSFRLRRFFFWWSFIVLVDFRRRFSTQGFICIIAFYVNASNSLALARPTDNVGCYVFCLI